MRSERLRFLLVAALIGSGSMAADRAAAGPFSNLVVFGDSLSDVGNISQATLGTTPGQYYWNARFSNGPVYAETLATGLALPPLVRSTASGNDFAYGGAQTSGTGGLNGFVIKDIDEQVDQFLATRTASASTLYVVFAGANDLLNGQTNMSIPVNSLSTSINRLVTAGARQFLVFNLPPLGDTPRYNGSQSTLTTYNTRSQQYNAALSTMLDGLHTSNPALTIYRYDVTSLFTQALANPQLFGLTNVTASAAPGLSPGDTSYDTSKEVPNPNQYLFWDDLHPTTTVHAILAQRALDLFRLPGDFNQDNVVNSADYILWRKGVSPSHIPDDYNVWRTHFGQIAASGAGTIADSNAPIAVPEPITLDFYGISAVLLAFRTGRPSKRARNRFAC